MIVILSDNNKKKTILYLEGDAINYLRKRARSIFYR